MSQMKPYCFKCGAELDPEAIYCPVCGRLQRSMVVRTVEPGAGAAPGQPYPEGYGQPAEPHGEQVPESGHVDSGFHPQYGDPEQWPAVDQQPAHEDQHQPYGDQHQPFGAQPAYGDQQQPYGEQPPYGDQHQPYGEQPPYGDQHQPYPGQPPYDEQQPYEQHQPYADDQPYGQRQPYAQDQPYGQDQPYDDQQPYAQQQPYGEHQPYADEQHYGQHQPPGEPHRLYPETAGEPPAPGQAEPAVQDPYAGSGWYDPSIEEARGEPALEPQPRRWDDPEQPGAEPQADSVYAGGSFPRPGYRDPVDATASRYDHGAQAYPGRDTPYAPYGTPGPGYRPPAPPPDYGDGRPAGGRNWMRLAALAVAALLGLFLVGFGIGQVFLGSPSSSVSTVTQPTPRQATAPPAATPTPGAATPTPATTPLAGGTATFVKVSALITPSNGCTTRQGCPLTVTLRNTGGQGGGTVTVTLTDEGHNPIATFTGPIPVTDAGQTVQVTGYATGDQLGPYLRSGGTVYVTTVNVQNNG